MRLFLISRKDFKEARAVARARGREDGLREGELDFMSRTADIRRRCDGEIAAVLGAFLKHGLVHTSDDKREVMAVIPVEFIGAYHLERINDKSLNTVTFRVRVP